MTVICEQFREGSRSRAICEGTSGLPPDKEAAYRANWERLAEGIPSTPKRPREPWPEPVGDYLAETFEWLAQVKSGSCGCKRLQAKMNRCGVAGCRENYALILDKLERAAFERGLPIHRLLFMAPLELAIYRASRHSTGETK